MQETRYTLTAIVIHWLMALLLIALFAVGLYMHELKFSPFKLQIYSWHKWAGVTAFMLVMLRLAWRIKHRPPVLPWTISKLAKLGAHIGHGVLYFLMIAIPLSGWLMSSAKGFQTVYFGVLPIPDLLAKDKALGDSLQAVHMILSYSMAAVVLGHITAAIKHHVLDKDDVLRRILPWRAR
ncbi:cytochrome b [Methylotenera mobilis]|uniref:Cytochrome B561 n=1 Tax=Methylotenera mobilis (strain JLW8 / ATCC BAA-1282 / DSM 17540) TaxID=583345 RepID=C6WVS6_METML|nr:cytochrome b [Methylotenera mobilis]ACT48025.1 cytochrome B561 [Methylotenera mobilis JLW8]